MIRTSRGGPAWLLLFVQCLIAGSCGQQEASRLGIEDCGEDPDSVVEWFALEDEWAVGGRNDTVVQFASLPFHSTPAPRGGLSTGHPATHGILTLNADGSVRSVIGRSGSGPGEWLPGTVARFDWFEDTLMVAQARPARIHRFIESGELIETRQVLPGQDDALQSLGVFRDGAILASMLPRIGGEGRRLVRWEDSEREADSLGLFQRDLTFRVRWTGGGSVVGMRPFSDHTLHALAPDGQSVVLVERGAATEGSTSEFRIRRIAQDGVRIADRMVCYRPSPVRPDELSDTVRVMSEALAPWSGVTRSETERLIRAAMPMPAFRPPVEDLVVSSSGDIWLRRESTPHAMSAWEIRDREGGLKGRLNLPSGVTVIAVSDSVVWSSQLDPWDVPVVSKNRLVRSVRAPLGLVPGRKVRDH